MNKDNKQKKVLDTYDEAYLKKYMMTKEYYYHDVNCLCKYCLKTSKQKGVEKSKCKNDNHNLYEFNEKSSKSMCRSNEYKKK